MTLRQILVREDFYKPNIHHRINYKEEKNVCNTGSQTVSAPSILEKALKPTALTIHLQKTQIKLLSGSGSISITWQYIVSLTECSRHPWSLQKRHRLKFQQMHSTSSMLLQMQIQCPRPLSDRREDKRIKTTILKKYNTAYWTAQTVEGRKSGLPRERGD